MKVLIPLLALLLAGCSTTTEYPGDWARTDPQPAVTCTPIDATFSNHGQKTNGEKPFYRARLGEILLPALPQAGITQVSLRLAADSPSVTAWAGSDLYETRAIPPDALQCKEGAWMLQNDATDWQMLSDRGMVGLMFLSVLAHDYERLYSQAADGALIVEETRHMAGVILLVPTSVKEKEWYRFPPAGTPAEDNAPSSPGGVLQPGAGYTRLLPPGRLDLNESYKTMNSCLDFSNTVMDDIGMDDPTPAERALLAGRSTQAFLYQLYPGGKPFFNARMDEPQAGICPLDQEVPPAKATLASARGIRSLRTLPA